MALHSEPKPSRLRIGARGSRLAVIQAEAVGAMLAVAWPGLACETVRISTRGDRQSGRPLPAIGGKGLFTQEIGQALLDGEVDLAVHSLKDLPASASMPGLTVAAIPARAPANDAVIATGGLTLDTLRQGARVGTSSPRRAAQLLAARPDLQPQPIRGNVGTRLRKLREGQVDALVVALAGLVRLGLAEEATQVLPFELMVPAPGQGALAAEIRADNAPVAEMLSRIGDPATTAAVTAERTLLQALGGGCSLPLGAVAAGDGETLVLRAALVSLDGRRAARAICEGPASDPEGLARHVAAELRAQGAGGILRDIRPD